MGMWLSIPIYMQQYRTTIRFGTGKISHKIVADFYFILNYLKISEIKTIT